MDRERGALLLVVVVLLTAGCSGALGEEDGEIVIQSEEGQNGQTFVSVASIGGQLQEGTEIAVEHTLPGVANVSGTLDRSADPGTRVYLGGPLGSEVVTEFRHGMPPNSGLVPAGVEVSVTVTVTTEERTATETFTFGDG